MTHSLTTLHSISSSLISNFVVIFAALICALISILGLITIAPTCPCRQRLARCVLLPKFTYLDHNLENWIASSECVICLSEFTAGEEVKVLPQCGHGFHVACVDMWLGSHSSCPSCRALAGDVAGEMETKSAGGENGEIGGANSNPNCSGSFDRYSHSVNIGFLP